MRLAAAGLFLVFTVPALHAQMPPSYLPPQPSTPASVSAFDESALKNAYRPYTGAALLEFFKKRLDTPGPEQIAELIKKLGEGNEDSRNRACQELVGLGTRVLPQLRQAANSLDDAQVIARAKACLQAIDGNSGTQVTTVAVRGLVRQNPPGAIEALLAYLPQSEDDSVAQEIVQALTRLGKKENRADAALVKALGDPTPCKRACAAHVVAHVGDRAQREELHKLYADPKPTVRLAAALGLARRYDNTAIPVVIDLLAELPRVQRQQCEHFLSELAGEWAVGVPPGNDDLSGVLRKNLWYSWWTSFDDKLLLDEFHKRTLSDTEREEVTALIQKLAADTPQARDEAMTSLLARGTSVVSLLRQASFDRNPVVNKQSAEALRLLEQGTPRPLPRSAIRMLPIRKPEGAVKALFAYIPFAESDGQADQLRDVLQDIAFADGKPDPVLVAALADRLPERRAVAAEILTARDVPEQRDAVRKLLKDPNALVRMRTALALTARFERAAVPVLIDLLAELPADQTWPVEDYLTHIAGEKAPEVSVGAEPEARKKCRDAWAAWWRDNEASVKLDNVDRLLGFTLVIEQYDPVKRLGKVLELDMQGRVRWTIEGLNYPYDAQVLHNGRVLIAEQNLNRVTERDLKGETLWTKQINNPFVAQRLPNGHTFIACRYQLVEVDREGKELVTINRPNEYTMAAAKLRDGSIAVVNNLGICTRFDSAGKELKSARLPYDQRFGMGPVEILPNGNVLMSSPNTHKVIEYDPDGKQLHEVSVNFPSSATKLTNGNLLVCTSQGNKVMEVDRSGRVVWEAKDGFRPYRAKRR
jgi:HEAT repeat protein